MDPATQPLEIEVVRDQNVRIRWSDGLCSVIPLAKLRSACPCAACGAERESAQRQRLPIVPGSAAQEAMAIVNDAELVGRYALRITWKDGHDGGIYDFALLRSLSRAEGAAQVPTAPPE